MNNFTVFIILFIINLHYQTFNTKNTMKNEGKQYGEGGNCICVSCKTIIPHKDGIPCKDMKCPKCGGNMIRKVEN